MPKLAFTLSEGMWRPGVCICESEGWSWLSLAVWMGNWIFFFFGFGYNPDFSRNMLFFPSGNFVQTQFGDFLAVCQEFPSAKQSLPGAQHCTLLSFAAGVWVCGLVFCCTCAWAALVKPAVSPGLISARKLFLEATLAGTGPCFPLPLQTYGWLWMPAWEIPMLPTKRETFRSHF